MSWMVGWSSVHAAEQHLAGDEVGQPVGHPHARQVGQERARGVADDQVLDARDRRGTSPRSRPTFTWPITIRSSARETVRASRFRPGGVSVIDVTTPEHHGHGAEQEDEEEARDPPPHQKACPTAKWKVNLLLRALT